MLGAGPRSVDGVSRGVGTVDSPWSATTAAIAVAGRCAGSLCIIHATVRSMSSVSKELIDEGRGGSSCMCLCKISISSPWNG